MRSVNSHIPVYCVNGEDCIPSDIRVTMLKASSYCRHQRLQQLRLFQLAEKPQRGATNEFIWMLQVLSSQIVSSTAFTTECLHHQHPNSKLVRNLFSSMLQLKFSL